MTPLFKINRLEDVQRLVQSHRVRMQQCQVPKPGFLIVWSLSSHHHPFWLGGSDNDFLGLPETVCAQARTSKEILTDTHSGLHLTLWE